MNTEIRIPTVENPELVFSLPLKPAGGHNIAMDASPTAGKVFLAIFFSNLIPGPFTFILFPFSLFSSPNSLRTFELRIVWFASRAGIQLFAADSVTGFFEPV